ncbi:hypothetical protein L1049_025085 [Liquidambar formosana]|uniref:F-box domain-containing protein n=1 Tax=Liquidambar formosana TaxID=63359 RepID=A0AAP0RX23_LIQFO
MWDCFPPEIYDEILQRLPVKTLVRCACVCKSWNSLIKNPSFATEHLNRTTTSDSSNSSSNGDLLLLRQYFGKNERERYSLRRDNRTLDEFAPLEFPFKAHSSNYIFRIVGSCNGVLCLSDDLKVYADVIILWNPSIRKFVTLPKPNVTYYTHGPHWFSLGFGFDARSNDYKVVKLLYPDIDDDKDEAVPEVELYSLSTGAWRGITPACGPFTVHASKRSQVFMNGAVHWPASLLYRDNSNSNFILSFDLGDEVFRKMNLPESLVHEKGRGLSIVELRGSLSVFTFAPYGRFCSIWVMGEYGVSETWSKQFTIHGEAGFLTPLSLRKNGEILVATRERLVSYHPETQWIIGLAICGTKDSFYLDTYKESLVLFEKESCGAKRKARRVDPGGTKRPSELHDHTYLSLFFFLFSVLLILFTLDTWY